MWGRPRASGVYTYRMAKAPMDAARAQNSSAVVSVVPAAPSRLSVNMPTSSSPPVSDLAHASKGLFRNPAVPCRPSVSTPTSGSPAASDPARMRVAVQ